MHRGSWSGSTPTASVASAARRTRRADLPPLDQQAAAGRRRCVALGLDLDGELLALSAASHSGETVPHRRRPRGSSRAPGWTSTRCRRPPDVPVRPAGRARRGCGPGRGPERVAMNCSGKHAAMLATCVVQRLGRRRPTSIPTTPCRSALRAAVERSPASRSRATGVDGCGAPLFGLTLTGLARAVRSLRARRARGARAGAWRTRCAPTRSGSAAPARRHRADARGPRTGRQGRRRGGLRRGARRRPHGRPQDRGRGGPGPAGDDGRRCARSASTRRCSPSNARTRCMRRRAVRSAQVRAVASHLRRTYGLVRGFSVRYSPVGFTALGAGGVGEDRVVHVPRQPGRDVFVRRR